MQLNKGIALVVVLMTIATIGGLAAIVFNRMIHELKHSSMDVGTVQSLMLARGGANVGTGILDGATFRSQLEAAVRKYAKSSEAWTFGGNNKTAIDPQVVASRLSLVAGELQTRSDTLFCSLSPTPSTSNGSVQVRMYFTASACGKSLPSKVQLPKGRLIEGAARSGATTATAPQIYALPFVMVSDSSQGAYRRNIVVQGEYRIRIGTSSFAYYAYLTNRRKAGLPFTSADMVDGPVHSNQYLRLKGKPWFGREVTVAGCTNPYPDTSQCGTKALGDYFSGVNSDNLVSDTTITANNACWSSTCPTFAGGKQFNADFISLPNQNNTQQAHATENGLYFNQSLKSLTLYAGDQDKNPLTKSGSNWVLQSGITTYQYIQACFATGPCQLYRYSSNDNLLYREQGGSWVQETDAGGYPKTFNGVVFADGGIEKLEGPKRTTSSDPDTAPPALASFAQITVAADTAIRLTGDLKYQDVPCESFPTKDGSGNVTPGSCNNKAAQNILGVYSLQGEVTFGTGDNQTLTNLTAHGVFMSGQSRVGTTGCFGVDNPSSCNVPWGNEVRIMGGLIGETVSGFYNTVGEEGYVRRIKYDERMLDGLSPPFFPTTSQEQVSAPIMLYGQREQVQ